MHCAPACNSAAVPKSFVTFDVSTERHFGELYANGIVFVSGNFKRKSFIYHSLHSSL